ncbi:hypothetical protein GH733_005493, partial [Mirounga leonina]
MLLRLVLLATVGGLYSILRRAFRDGREVLATPQSPPAHGGRCAFGQTRHCRSSKGACARTRTVCDGPLGVDKPLCTHVRTAMVAACPAVFTAGNCVKIAPGAVVCVESEIRGDVTIGPRTVIHPKARIIAEAGPIVIGEGNLIEEQALIINAHPDNITPDAEDPEPKPMIIGTNNVFEVGCYSQAMKMGDNNVIESKAYVGRNVILTSGCIIGACCNLNTFEVIPENTVIYDTTAGFPDENLAKLPPPKEDYERKLNS